MTPAIAARLADSAIEMAAQAREYSLFVRGNCLALVKVEDGRFVSLGSSGILTENGIAYLVWVEGKAMLSSHGSQVEAVPEQVDAIRDFSKVLKEILWAADEHR